MLITTLVFIVRFFFDYSVSLLITPLHFGEGLGVGLLVITCFSMFVNIQSFVLNAAINTQTMQLLDAIE